MSDEAVGLTADKVCDSALAFESVCRLEKGAGEILSGITARFAASRLVALVGADGAGKTTLMRIAAGILQPSAGHVLVFGEELYGKKLAHLQKQCGYMPQKFGLYEDLSVAENFKLYADLFGLSEEQRKERTKELLEMTALTAFTERPAGKLSGGMKQKLGLACALLNRPRILLLDEPTVGVDPLSRRDLWRILRENAAARDMLIVVATTYMDEAALCDDVIILEEGHMRVTGTPESIARHAQGCTFFAEQEKKELPVRLLQDRLIADTEHLLDAVPEAAGVRLLTNGTSDAQKLQALYPGVRFTERPSTLEDGYLVLRKEFLGDWRLEAEKSLSLFESSAIADSDPAITKEPDDVIHAKGLVRRFGSFVAVDKTDFDVARGEIFGLLGPNGAGKTTTFKMLCGLLEVSEGELCVAGIDVRHAREKARELLGYMSQKFSLYPGLSVLENLTFFAGAYGLTGSRGKQRIAQVLQAFGLETFASRAAGSLPGGYKQRLSMATALLHRPQILFLDEPTSGADIPTRRRFWRWVTALARNGTTVVVTTHFMEEALYCDRILIQDAGKSLILGTPEAVRSGCATMNEAFIRVVTQARHAEADRRKEAS